MSVGSMKNPHLKQLLLDAERMGQDATALFAEVSEAQLAWRPTPKSWSVSEVLEHLIKTGEMYHPSLRESLRYVRDNNVTENSRFRPSLMGRFFIKALSASFKLPAPKQFLPPQGALDAVLQRRFVRQHEEFMEILTQADGYDLNKVKFVSPVSKLLRFSLGEGLTIIVHHARRHFKQISRIRDAEGFPK